MTEEFLWTTMMAGKADRVMPQAFAILARTINFTKRNLCGREPEFIKVAIPAGTKVRVVMASRFGDVGITDDLSATRGYGYRTQCVPGEFEGKAIEPAGLLKDIELIES